MTQKNKNNNNNSEGDEGNSFENEFKIPQKLLDQIEEMSGGGFIFFILGSDGQPEIYESYDTIAHESLVKAFAADWLSAEREARREDLKREISFGFEMSEELSDDEDDEDED